MKSAWCLPTLKQAFKYNFNPCAQLSRGRRRMHKWNWRGEMGCGGSGSENPKVTGYLETWFHCSLRFYSNSCYVFVWTGGSFVSENLISRDQLICSSLEEKLQVFAALSALSGRVDASLVDPRLLVQQHSEDMPQAAMLLAAALQEGELFDTPVL